MTTLALVLAAIGVLLVTAVAAVAAGRHDRLAIGAGTVGAVAGAALGLIAAAGQLARGGSVIARPDWSLPLGTASVGLDALSAFFLLCVFLVAGLSAAYGAGYLAAYAGRRRLGAVVASFNVLVAAMAGLVIARDAVLFLVAWEVMTVASFLLVTFESDRESVQRAGITYLVASQLGVVALFLVFALLKRGAPGFEFAQLAAAGPPPAGLAAACFLLALLGFGIKAGFWPVHVWLPDAHPAAPSHVSALMSGVMIKMGIYGLLRTLTLLGPPPTWWGATVVAVGVASGLAGVLYALAQHDVKRLLAYHSIENVGIIALGVGVGLLGQSHGDDVVAFLGYAGALLHVLNHGLFKGLLFQGAGAVLQATGTRNLDELGGLARRMPVTALAFLVGAVAIAGLPPLNGFVSEWLILMGAFRGGATLSGGAAVAAVAVLPALALIGGLAVACFVKVYGVVFLGTARAEAPSRARECGRAMRVPMLLGAGLCVALGVLPVVAVGVAAPAAAQLGGLAAAPSFVAGSLSAITTVAAVLVLLVAGLAVLHAALLSGRPVPVADTWGCGYVGATPRMQYTAASFAQPVLAPFGSLVQRTIHADRPAGFFPASAAYAEHVADMAGERLLVPAVRRVVGAFRRLRVLQQGRIQLYLAYILITLLVLLTWQVAVAGR